MRQRAQVDLGVCLPYHIRKQPNYQRGTEPHKPYKARREEAAAQPRRHARRRVVVSHADLQRIVRVPRMLRPAACRAVDPDLGRAAEVVLARPPARREDALRLAERVAQPQVALLGQQDTRRNHDWHCHDAERPRDPDGVVCGEELGLGHVVQCERADLRQHGDEADGEREAEGAGPPVEAVEVEDFGDPDERSEVVEGVIHGQVKPKVYLDLGLAVARRPVPAISSAGFGVPVPVLVIAQRILGERDRAPSHRQCGGQQHQRQPPSPPGTGDPAYSTLLGRDP